MNVSNVTQLQQMLGDKNRVLAFLRTRYPMIHASNLFYRDLVYGLQTYLAGNGIAVRVRESEKFTRAFIDAMVRDGTFIPCDRQTWTLNYPEFRTPVMQKVAPVKTSAAATVSQ